MWENYKHDENTWKSYEHLFDVAPELLASYYNKYPEIQKEKR
jgi:hypothetical protein